MCTQNEPEDGNKIVPRLLCCSVQKSKKARRITGKIPVVIGC